MASLHTAIEMPDPRGTDIVTVGAAQLIADNACAHRFVLGPQAPAHWRGLDLAAHGLTLAAGQVLTTGTCVIPLEIAPGDTVSGDYGVFGTVGMRCAAA